MCGSDRRQPGQATGRQAGQGERRKSKRDERLDSQKAREERYAFVKSEHITTIDSTA